MIQQYCIEQVKGAAIISEVVGKFLTLKKDGVNLTACCPFHNEKSPSFKVSATKNIFKCFGCGVSGDSIEFVMKHENKNYIEALTVIAGMYNIELVEEETAVKKNYVKPVFIPNGLSIEGVNYFKSRYINANTLQELKVTQVNEWMPKAKKPVETICFNYFRNDEIVNIKYRALADKDFKLSKDAELIFYNLDSIRGAETVVIVEGEMDCLSVHQSGFKAVVSVPNGAAKGNQKLDYLNNCWESFATAKRIILMVDNDEPGIMLRDELARRFGFDRCYKVDYPKGCKDANDILMKLGAPSVIDCINYAVEFPIEGVFSMNELLSDVENYYTSGYPMGIRVGIPNFDDHLRLMLGQLTTITGIPSAGKSEFTDYIITECAKNNGWSAGICSFENQPSSLHVTKIMEKYVGKSFAPRFNDADRISRTEFDKAVNFVNDNFYFININKIDVTLQGILDKAKELILRKGIKMLLIDPWNYIEHKFGKGQTETQYISESLTKLKAFALTHNIHVILIAHPAKMPKNNGKYEVPTLYSISGSAHFFNKTDNGITVYRDFENKTVEIHIQKVRYSWLGEVGSVTFTYDVERRQYRTESVKINESEPAPAQPQDNPQSGFQTQTQRVPETFWNKD